MAFKVEKALYLFCFAFDQVTRMATGISAPLVVMEFKSIDSQVTRTLAICTLVKGKVKIVQVFSPSV